MTPNDGLVEVTKLDINRGIPKSAHYCPVARALKRKFRTGNVAVMYTSLRVYKKYYKIPREILEFIRNLDDQLDVMPISFELELSGWQWSE